MEKRRVVVTGLGLVSPLGVGVEASWKKLIAGQSGVRRITHFDASDFPAQVAAQVPGEDEEDGFKALDWLGPKDAKKMDRFIQLGMAASVEAIRDAGVDNVDADDAERVGVILGSGIGGLGEIERTAKVVAERGPRRVSPFYIPSILINMLSGHVSMRFGYKGPNDSTVTACATSAHALGVAKRTIEMGEADVMIAGGAEACITPTCVAGFAAAKALSCGYNDTPEKASRPFDKGRDGFVIGEGAAVMVLEEYEHAKARGAHIYAELAGFGQTADAYHMTLPSPGGEGAARAMKLSLKDAAIDAADVGYVNAHATSTPAGDEIESQAIESVFGANVVVSSTKSMTGHLLGAAGALESIVCVKALEQGVVPPTINLDDQDEACPLDYVPNVAREVPLKAALSNSFGFGGTNASLVFKKVIG